jgi:hypothetical protein
MHEHGGVVFPVGRPGNPKAPHPNLGTKENGGGWIKYRDARPSDLELDIWARWNPTGWAVVTGACSGLVIFDADDDDAVKLCESWDLTPAWVTPGGGKHFAVRHPGDLVKTVAGISDPGFADVVGLSSLDVRGDCQGYAVFRSAGYTWDGESFPTVNPWDSIPDDVSDYLLGVADFTPGANPFETPAPSSPATVPQEIEDEIHAFAVANANGQRQPHLKHAAIRAKNYGIAPADTVDMLSRLHTRFCAENDQSEKYGTEEIERLVTGWADVKISEDPERVAQLDAAKNTPRIQTYTFADLGNLPPRQDIIGGFLAGQSDTFLIGRRGTLKSQIVIAAGVAITCGVEFLGHPVRRQGAFVYVPGEGLPGIRQRIASELPDGHQDPGPFVVLRGANPFTARGIRDLLDTLAQVQDAHGEIVAVAFDTLHRITPGMSHENPAHVAVLFDHYQQIRDRFGCSTITVAHTAGGDGEDVRGSTSYLDGADQAWHAKPQPDGVVKLVNVKAKDTAKLEPITLRLAENPDGTARLQRAKNVAGAPKATAPSADLPVLLAVAAAEGTEGTDGSRPGANRTVVAEHLPISAQSTGPRLNDQWKRGFLGRKKFRNQWLYFLTDAGRALTTEGTEGTEG